MSIRLRPLSALIVIAVSAWSQETPAQSQPEIASEQAPITFSSRVNLISVPVVVRGRDGHAVGDLQKENFQVFDKGKLQVITKFSIEKSVSPVEMPGASNLPRQQEPSPVPSQPVLPERYVAYLVDDIHLDRGDLLNTRLAMHRHLDESVDPTSRAAIFTTTGLMLSDFTADREKLHAAINKVLPYTSGPDAQQDCVNVSYYIADLLVNKLLYLDGHLFTDERLVQFIQGGSADPALVALYAEALSCISPCPGDCSVQAMTKLRVATRLALTYGDHDTATALGALRDVARKLSAMPGNRNLVLVSPGFLLTRDHRSDEYDVLDRAIRASVTINTIDMRGLFAIIPGGDSSQHGARSADATTVLSRYANEAATEADDVLGELAAGTGGTFFHNDNSLKDGLNVIAARPEYVYVLGFSPQDLKLDGAYHALKVIVKNPPGLLIQARRGYWAPNHKVDPAEAAKEEIEASVFSREEIREIPVDLQTEFFKTGDFQAELTVTARLDLQGVTFRKAADRNIDLLTVVTGLFDANGNYISGVQRLVNMHLRDQTLVTLQSTGFKVQETFNVAAPGRYVIRLVVRDAEGHRTTARNGGVEIQ